MRPPIPNLPEEIWIDIFLRLPAKSICNCRCVAKPWRTLLSTPQFIKSHLTRKTQEERLILITPPHSIHYYESCLVSRKLDLHGFWTEFVGSCDGLVLFVNREHEKLLLNPLTREQVKIPNSPLALKRTQSFSMHGFGCDKLRHDYKVVTLSYYKAGNEHEQDCVVDTFVDVYSVKRAVWKRVECSPYDHSVPEISSGAFVNGAIHWLASSRESRYPFLIAAFDLSNDVFSEIHVPNCFDVGSFVSDVKLMVLGGCLCMTDARNGRMDVWIMVEYGLDYWWDFVKLIGFTRGWDVLLATYSKNFVAHNLRDNTRRELFLDGVPDIIGGGSFVESLISPVFDGN